MVRLFYQPETKAVGVESATHDKYLTDLIKSIRKDLKIVDRDFPAIFLKK
jgi:hypothetical protein